MQKVTLFHGDNGVAEFWESADSKVLIQKLHTTSYWLILIDGRLVHFDRKNLRPKGAHRLDKVSEMLKEDHGIEVIFDDSKEWVEQDMILAPTS